MQRCCAARTPFTLPGARHPLLSLQAPRVSLCLHYIFRVLSQRCGKRNSPVAVVARLVGRHCCERHRLRSTWCRFEAHDIHIAMSSSYFTVKTSCNHVLSFLGLLCAGGLGGQPRPRPGHTVGRVLCSDRSTRVQGTRSLYAPCRHVCYPDSPSY